jgi:trk system potassium uptake protein TrkH
MHGSGGERIYRAENTEPSKDAKVTPRIDRTAKALWNSYLDLTLACDGAYWLAGMSMFDAIGHSFSTVSIGGFAMHGGNFGYFDSALIEMIAVVFMILGARNFASHVVALRRRSLEPYRSDSAFRTYIGILCVIPALAVGYLLPNQTFTSPATALHQGVFQVVSVATTTGFTVTSFHEWPAFLPVLLIFASFIGGCASSTGGGLKVIRVLLLFKQGVRELTRLVHPSAQVAVKVGRRALDDRVIQGVWGFFAAYVMSFSVGMLLLMASGLDQVTAFSAMAACINNLGPGLGEVADNFRTIGDTAKWVLAAAMLLGRPEIFTSLVLLTPDFWPR